MYFIFLTIICLLIIINFKYISEKIKIFDKPDNKRKIHKKTVPLLGGPLIFLIIFITILYDILFDTNNLLENRELISFTVGVIFIFLIGLHDDKYNLSPIIKLVLVFITILLIINIDNKLTIEILRFSFLDSYIQLSSFSKIFTILCFLIFINALNMFDGLNGQCTVYSLVLVLIFNYFSKYNLYLFSILITLIFFLYLNLKNKSFLGDSGSYLLGFILSYFIIKSYNSSETINAEVIFILMFLPGFDMIRLFIQRISKNKNPFKADKNHIHHIYLKKFNENYTLFFIQTLSFVPFFLTFIIDNFFIVFLTAVLIYVMPIYLILKK